MKKQAQGMEFTKASSKGQIVIPTRIRKKLDIREGSVLAVAAEKGMIVLKKVESGLSADDLKTLKLVEEAWKDIEGGRYKVRDREAFFKELKGW
jgi:AbrB family looped-hinge helix DNA binding protein